MKKWDLKWMAWEVTSQCNMACIHCRSSSEFSSTSGLFDKKRSIQLLDDIKEFASPVIVLTGGEPLMRDDLFELAEMGTARGFRMATALNGSLVTEDVCKNINESGIRIVSLSLDGPNEEIHDDFRQQKGAFDAVMNAADLFNKHNIKFIINSSFTKRNQPYIGDTYRLAKKLGAHAWYLFLIVPTGRGEDIMKELVSKEDYEEILRWHYEMERSEDELLVRPTCAPQYYRLWHQLSKEDNMSADRRSLTFSTGGGKGCIAAQSICFVSSIGNVYPCSYFPLSAGNVLEEKFENIWNNSELFKDLRSFKDYEGKCGACRYLGVCGGCRARSYAVTGSYMAEEPFCNYIPENFKG